MRAITLISLLYGALASGPALASAGIKIAAGEHHGYSRIVAPPDASDVFIDRDANTVDIQFSPPATAFDLSDINDAHKAYRISGAEQITGPKGPVIRIKLNCDCNVDAKRRMGGKFVIDIADRKIEAQQAQEIAGQDQTNQSSDKKNVSVEEARTKMRALLERAASEGFVTMRDGEQGAVKAPNNSPPPETEHAEAKPKPKPNPSPAMRLAQPAPQPPASCQPDTAFAIDGGKFDDDPLGAIAELRASLESAPPDQVESITNDFVRGYLAIGFGEEALALLADRGEQDSLLADMARVVAERGLSPSGRLLGAVDCRGAHALWQAAAAEPGRAAEAAARAGDAISSLPIRLRTLLAIRIAKKLIDADAWSDVKKYYRIAQQGSKYATADLQYIAARLLEHDGETAQAETLLRNVSAGDSQAAQDALLALANRYAQDDKPPGKGFVEDLGALATTGRGSPRGGEAALHEARIWTKAGNIEAGIFLLRSAAEGSEPLAQKASEEARKAIVDAFASGDPDQRLGALRSFVEYRAFVERDARAPDLREEAAKAALEYGLPNLAIDLLGDEANGENPRQSLLRARAALAAGDAETALASAAPYADDPDFGGVIVHANLQLHRDYAALAAASALPESAEKSELTAEAAWRAGEFGSALRAYRSIDPTSMKHKDAIRFALSAYMAGASETPPTAEAVLQKDGEKLLPGVNDLFSDAGEGPIISRGKALAKSADEEINFIRELLSHG